MVFDSDCILAIQWTLIFIVHIFIRIDVLVQYITPKLFQLIAIIL